MNLPIELNNDGMDGTCLQNMVEDCLLEIFSAKPLDGWMDLCSIAETCKRFKEISGRIIPKTLVVREHPSSDVHDSAVKSRNDEYEPLMPNEVERIFNNFGSILSGIHVDCNMKMNSVLLELIAKHCRSTNNLKCLSISNVKIGKILEIELKSIFKRLRQLELDGVSGSCDMTLFPAMSSLLELSVDGCDADAILTNNFPKLERFTCGMFNGTGNKFTLSEIVTLEDFISRHSTLKTLSVSVLRHCSNGQIVQAISNSCHGLEELTLRLVVTVTSAWLQPLHTLKSLKFLTLTGVDFDEFEFITRLPELRELTLNLCRLPDDVSKQFVASTKLTKLTLRHCYATCMPDVVNVVSRMENLQHLAIWLFKRSTDGSLFNLDVATFSKIIGVVKERPNVLTLKCLVAENFDLKNLDESQKVKLITLSLEEWW